MLDIIIGRPSAARKRIQIWVLTSAWIWLVACRQRGTWRKVFMREGILKTLITLLCGKYIVDNFEHALGFSAPKPLSNLYTPSFYRALHINTGLDAGFLTATSIKNRMLRDIASILFSAYYILRTDRAAQKVRRYHAFPTVNSLRTAWNKAQHPLLRFLSFHPKVTICRKIRLDRPLPSQYTRQITCYLFFNGHEASLSQCPDLILDLPGGGFVAMSPEDHQGRLRQWAIRTGKAILSLDYGKAPEYPYPFAIDEAFDLYTILHDEPRREELGLFSGPLNIILTGDSAGATLAVNVTNRIIEQNQAGILITKPAAMVLSYPALDFNFSSWMKQEDLETLYREKMSLPMLPAVRRVIAGKAVRQAKPTVEPAVLSSTSGEVDRQTHSSEGRRSPGAFSSRLTMTSRAAAVHDPIISLAMMRAMAMLYIGRNLNPDFAKDYRLSPILTPQQLLADYPPVILQCGEQDPFVDDTVTFAAKIRQAKNKAATDLGLQQEHPDKWAKVVLFSGWSHGYLQMGPILPEANAAILRLGDLIEELFVSLEKAETPVVKTLRRKRSMSTTSSFSQGVQLGGASGEARKQSHRISLPIIASPVPRKRVALTPVTNIDVECVAEQELIQRRHGTYDTRLEGTI